MILVKRILFDKYMERKIIVLFFLSMYFLSGCEGKQKIYITPTTLHASATSGIPTVSPSPTMTPYPTSIEEPTIIAFATLMANVCPTTTPSAEQIDAVGNLADADIQREFAGRYFIGTGFWSFVLIINCDGTFYQQTITDFGPRIFQAGKVTVQNEHMILNGVNEDNQLFDGSYIPVRWAQRKYLIEADRLKVFCEAVQSTEVYKEPRDEDSFGLFYLRDGDENLKAIGNPLLPSGDKVCE
jgi:hypothetical protein